MPNILSPAETGRYHLQLEWDASPSSCIAILSVEDTKQSVSAQRNRDMRLSCYNRRIVRFFPHEIADLSIALDYILMQDGPTRKISQWALRYVVLLWLSLICMIPFDLAQFDEAEQVGQTANTIESLAKGFLGYAGLEREGAAILLSRLYLRYDSLLCCP